MYANNSTGSFSRLDFTFTDDEDNNAFVLDLSCPKLVKLIFFKGCIQDFSKGIHFVQKAMGRPVLFLSYHTFSRI